MARIDLTLWDNPKRMRDRIKNLATMVLTGCGIGLYVAIGSKNWIIVGILALHMITTIPVFISYTKWQKIPPKQ